MKKEKDKREFGGFQVFLSVFICVHPRPVLILSLCPGDLEALTG